MKPDHPAGPPMTLGNMRQLGVQHLVATCLKDACRHQGLIDVSKYPDNTCALSFAAEIVCAKCGGRGCRLDLQEEQLDPERSTEPILHIEID